MERASNIIISLHRKKISIITNLPLLFNGYSGKAADGSIGN